MTETDSRHAFEAGSCIYGPLAARGPWLADLGEAIRHKQRTSPLTPQQLEGWAQKLCDECYEQVSVDQFLLPTGSMRKALAVFAHKGKSRFVIALPKKTDSENELLLYFEGDLAPSQTEIDEVAHAAHDIFKDCSFT